MMNHEGKSLSSIYYKRNFRAQQKKNIIYVKFSQGSLKLINYSDQIVMRENK